MSRRGAGSRLRSMPRARQPRRCQVLEQQRHASARQPTTVAALGRHPRRVSVLLQAGSAGVGWVGSGVGVGFVEAVGGGLVAVVFEAEESWRLS